ARAEQPGQSAGGGAEQPHAQIRLGGAAHDAAHFPGADRQRVERQAGGGDQSADEAATGGVVAAQQDPDRERQGDPEDVAGAPAQDQGVHSAGSFPSWRSDWRTAKTAMAARPSTEISPSVSRARKSTRITLTTF